MLKQCRKWRQTQTWKAHWPQSGWITVLLEINLTLCSPWSMLLYQGFDICLLCWYVGAQCKRICLPKQETQEMWVPCRRKWKLTPLFLPGNVHGQRSYSPEGCKEVDTTDTHIHTHWYFLFFRNNTRQSIWIRILATVLLLTPSL